MKIGSLIYSIYLKSDTGHSSYSDDVFFFSFFHLLQTLCSALNMPNALDVTGWNFNLQVVDIRTFSNTMAFNSNEISHS